MKREEFARFVESTLEEVIHLAEEKCGQQLPRQYAFRWLGRSHQILSENIVEQIVQRIFVDEELIYPCVDIGVADILENGTLLIVGNVAGYAPRSFGLNWTGREGPFVHIVGQPLLNRIAGKQTNWSPEGTFSFSIPEMEKRGG
jgi:hypothetical protein